MSKIQDQEEQTSISATPTPALTLGTYAHEIIGKQFRQVIKQQKHVLADNHPEHLHQMRVASRRLYTALQVFEGVVELPKAAQANKVRSLVKVLGNLRDLDVQTAALEDDYRPQLSKKEQHRLDEALSSIKQQRRKAFSATEKLLNQSLYQDLCNAFSAWLERPEYRPVAQLPLVPLLPDLLNPLLSELFLHSGWLISTSDLTDDNVHTLHDLRKACKHVRYQADFFQSFYGDPFQQWIEEIKELQDSLGQLQDIQVLHELLSQHLPKDSRIDGLLAVMGDRQSQALVHWEPTRQKYLDNQFRRDLRRLVLEGAQTPSN
jgi:CHAD domain-containing protein